MTPIKFEDVPKEKDGKYTIGIYNLDNGLVLETNEHCFRFIKANAKLHREDGPACVYYVGSQLWVRDAQYHREYGPALINNDGKGSIYFFAGARILSEQQYFGLMQETLKSLFPHSPLDKHLGLYQIGPEQWVRIADNRRFFYKDKDETILHREDGPAIQAGPSMAYYYLDGIGYTYKDYNARIKQLSNTMKEKSTMSNKKYETEGCESDTNITDKLKDAFIEGAKRNGVRQMTDAAMLALRATMAKAGPEADGINAFLASPLAKIFAKNAAGYALREIPQLKDNKLAQIVGTECCNQGAEDFQVHILGSLMAKFSPAIEEAFSSLEKTTSFRVLADQAEKEEKIDKEESESVETVSIKRNGI
mgnify:FL=1